MSTNTGASGKTSGRCCGLPTFWWKVFGVVILVGAGLVIWQQLQPEATEGIDPTSSSQKKEGEPNEPSKKIVKGSITDLLNDHPMEKAEHVLDPLLKVAEKGLEKLRAELVDYSAVIKRQEQVKGKLQPEEEIEIKIRQPQKEKDGKPAVARAIYTSHLSPKNLKGQKAIWVDGWNNNKLVAKPAFYIPPGSFSLPVDGMLAMRGNRYPMTEAGFEVLIVRMLEKGRRDRNHGDCEVEIDRNFKINGRDCTLFTIKHPVKKEPFDFHIAQIAIDDKINLPIFYQSKGWPEKEGEQPPLLERYSYSNIKINPGFTENDFDPKHNKFPGW